MISKLKSVKEIGVVYRTNHLLQFSTRTRDFVIDITWLNKEVQSLNSVFMDANILKVVYRPNEILALEGNHRIRTVNMFSIYVAATNIGNKVVSINQLVLNHCAHSLPKTFAGYMKKWKDNEKALELVQGQSHYLLQLHDHLRNQLLARDKEALTDVYETCTNVCKGQWVHFPDDVTPNHPNTEKLMNFSPCR